MPTTIDDFWRLVWQENSRVIVMITMEVEGGKVRARVSHARLSNRERSIANNRVAAGACSANVRTTGPTRRRWARTSPSLGSCARTSAATGAARASAGPSSSATLRTRTRSRTHCVHCTSRDRTTRHGVRIAIPRHVHRLFFAEVLLHFISLALLDYYHFSMHNINQYIIHLRGTLLYNIV